MKFSLVYHLYFKDGRVEFLQKMVPSFFGHMQHALLNEVILGLCKLTDPPHTSRNKNFSLTRLADIIQPQSKKLEVLSTRIYKRIERKDVQAIRAHRNKRLSHNDYDVIMNDADLPGFSLEQIEKIFSDFFKILDKVSMELFGAKIMYTNEMQAAYEADYVFEALMAGKKTAGEKINWRDYKWGFSRELNTDFS